MKADDLALDWELGVFRALRALWRWAAPERPAFDADRAARLEDHVGPLERLAQLVAGRPVRVLPGRGAGGVRGRDLLLPPFIDLAPDPEANRGLYVLRTAHAATISRLLLADDVPAEPTARLRHELSAARTAADALRDDLPAFGPAWDAACALVLATRADVALQGRARLIEDAVVATLSGHRPWEDDARFDAVAAARPRGPDAPPVPLWGGLFRADLDDATTGETADRDGAALPDGTEIEAPPVEDVRRVLLDPRGAEEKVLQHTFEKVETADTFQGQVQVDDGDDELEEQLEALDEVDLGQLVRGGQDAHSIYKADVGLGAGIPDVATVAPGERGVPYDEWDVEQTRYRKGWCTVYPARVPLGRPGWARDTAAKHRRLIERLRRRLEDHRARLEDVGRQRDGEHPDLDALVDHHADVAAGRTGSQRLYVRRRPRRRDFATTVLLDVSLSADSWVDDRRVLDVAREAVLVLGEVADALGDRLQVLAFASSTRNRCRVWTVKDWNDPWHAGRARLGALEPQGYTRIGAALRHATAGLSRTPADAHLLLLVSDGKPTDFDRYEGRHGVADVRMALREAERVGVTTHALAIDAVARSYLPSMLGNGRWDVLPTPDHLLTAMTVAYGRMTGR